MRTAGPRKRRSTGAKGPAPAATGNGRVEDYYTVLILGRDTGGGGNTDTMLLASYDVTNQKATVMSIPRDTMVNVSWDIKRINSVYNYYGGGDQGIQYLYKEIAQLVGFEPDYQVVVEWDAVGQIVDAMGGVWFDVPRNMNYDDPYQDLHIHQEKGYRLLTGDDAMQVLRYRHDNDMRYGYPDGDLGRIKTQQAFLTAMVDAAAADQERHQDQPVHPGVPEQCGDRPELPEYPMVCPAGDSGWAEHGERGVCHHAQPDRILLEPHLSQLSILCGAQRG